MSESFDMSKYVPGSLFAEPAIGYDHEKMACVGTNGGPYEFSDFAFGYFDAARRLYDSLEKDSWLIDVLVYPITFLYRQGFELAIKHLIYLLSSHYGTGTSPELKHGLCKNWMILRPLVERHAISHPYRELASGQLDGIEAIIRDFDKFDPSSFVFRYPEDKSRGAYITKIDRIDVVHLNRELTVAQNWFERLIEQAPDDMIA